MKNKNLIFIVGIFLVIILSNLAIVGGGGLDNGEITATVERTPVGSTTVSKVGDTVILTYERKGNLDGEVCFVAEDLDGCKHKKTDNKVAFGFQTTLASEPITVTSKNGCTVKGRYKCGFNDGGFTDLIITVGAAEEAEEKCIGDDRECKEKCEGNEVSGAEINKPELDDWCKKQKNNKEVCCIKRSCNNMGGKWVENTREAKQANCLKDKEGRFIEYFGLSDQETHPSEVCCKGKEKARESVKKPGTLGRLGICLGITPSESDSITRTNKHLQEVIAAISKIEKIKQEVEKIKKEVEKIKEIEDPMAKVDEVDRINEEMNKIYIKIGELKEKKDAADNVKNLNKAQDELMDAKDSVQKIKKMHAVTWVECLFTDLSILSGLGKAGFLAFGDMGSCSTEQPLPGAEACLSCNEDPYRICTKERCEILGRCIPVPTAKGDQYNCIPGKCEELGLVGMSEGKIEWYIDGELNGTKPAEISQGNIKTDLGEIPFNTKNIMINLTTDKPAQCRWVLDQRGANFSDMEDFEDNYYPMLPGGIPRWQYASILLPGDIARDEEHRIFIKCNNVCDVKHGADYDQNYIQFRLAKKPDQLPPEIVHIDPENNAVVNGDWKNLTASFWLDELGKCKYSDKTMNYTTDYEEMKYFSEKPNENSSVIAGTCYPAECLHLTGVRCTRCELELDLSKGYEELNWTEMPPEMQEQLEESLSNITKFFNFMIRCEDTAKNVMIEDDTLDYNFMTMPGYNITVLKPEMQEKTYDRQPEIEVTSEPRETECKYKTYQGNGPKTPPSWDEMYYIDEFFDTIHQSRHNETLNATKTGMLHTLWARCRDIWQIEAINFTRFYTLLDEDPPIAIRLYHDTTVGDYLIIETDENSTCVYGTSSSVQCNYNFSDGSAMTGILEPVHAAYWQLDHLYYIKCVDRWDNYPGGSPEANVCTTIINPYEVPPL